MRVIGGLLAVALALLAIAAMPPWRRLPLDGRWLRLIRPERPADLPQIVAAHDHPRTRNFLLPAAVLRDNAAAALARTTGTADPLYQLPERELVKRVTDARGAEAGGAVSRLYKRLRGLPSRSQAAAPWSRGKVSKRELQELHRDVHDLYRKLGDEHED
jgi:hypothetical protein